MISVEGLSVEFNATPLFEDVSYVINKKDRIALVGKNGAGKSTMLKILAGLQSPTRGVVATPKDVTIGYLPQVMILSDNRTVMGEAELAFEHIFELQAKLERMNQELAERTDYDSEEYHQLIDRFTHENDRFLMMGGTNFQAEIERTLLGLGFSREDFERPTSEFSGGWRMRIELAKLLLRRPDVLLLDEPTNHMDIPAKETLESAFKAYTGTMLFVSHDRYFIKQVADAILVFEKDKVMYYPFGYDHYISRLKASKDGNLPALMQAKDAAMVEALAAVPKRERHETRQLSTDEAYLEWKLTLAAEPVVKAAEEAEKVYEELCEAESELNEENVDKLRLQYEKVADSWTNECTKWYDIYLDEMYPESDF